MITTGTRWFLGLGLVTLVVAAAYGWATGGDGLGPLSLGYKGGVGDHVGYGLLVAAGLVSIFHALVMTAVRDGAASAEAETAGVASLPPVRPAALSYWPVVASFGAGLLLIGLVTEALLFVAGTIVLGVVVVEWAVQTWAEHATGDPATNRRIRNRIMYPVEFPVAGALAVAILIISISRVLLATSELGAVWVAIGVASVILLGGAFLAARPKLSSNVIVALLLVLAVVAIAAGVTGGLAGKREFHPIDTGHELEEEL